MEGITSLYVTKLPGLVATGITVKDICLLIHHVTMRDHMFKGFCDFIGGSFLQYVTTLPTVATIGQLW